MEPVKVPPIWFALEEIVFFFFFFLAFFVFLGIFLLSGLAENVELYCQNGVECACDDV